jgi:hypothetical protein
MNFYTAIEPFLEYFFSIRKLETYLSFDLVIPKTWGMPKSVSAESQLVPFESPNPETTKGISVVCEATKEETDKTVKAILKIIKANKEREEKEILFNEVISTLKKTFESSDLNHLKKLQFHFETDKPKELEEDEPTETIGLAE